MRTIGLIGGMSWESTAIYYRLINQAVRARLGAPHSARIVLHSLDFHDIEPLQQAGDWGAAGAVLADAARSVVRGGADCVVLCTNTMHRVADAIVAAVDRPLLHIADATAQALRRDGHAQVGLLGTRFTMEQPFYRDRLRQAHGIDSLIPEPDERAEVHRIIYDELCQGHIDAASRDCYWRVIAGLIARGAEAVILGCTEIGLLVDQADASVPLFDTARIHAEAAVDFALGAQ